MPRIVALFESKERDRFAELETPFDLAAIGPPYCICAGEIFVPGVALDADGLPAITGQVAMLADAGQVGCDCEDES